MCVVVCADVWWCVVCVDEWWCVLMSGGVC